MVTSLLGSVYPTVGASGGLFGLLLAFAHDVPEPRDPAVLRDPDEGAVPGRAVRRCSSCYQGVYVMNSGVAHFAHLGGMVGGLLMIRYWRGQAAVRTPIASRAKGVKDPGRGRRSGSCSGNS